jgi:hypothetical protein
MSHSFANLPDIVAHADWSAHAKKRWIAVARRSKEGFYQANAPRQVGKTENLLGYLQKNAGPQGLTFIGFDFPIGLPLAYAKKTGIEAFMAVLPKLGRGRWREFYSVAERPEQIDLYRPFYPKRPGGARHQHLVTGLGMETINDLRRQCDYPYRGRRAAAPLFWTLGGQQVGKAAISGWKGILAPGLQDPDLEVLIWPFSGHLTDLLQANRIVIAETYPAEIYTHLGIEFSPSRPGAKSGKRIQADRALNAAGLLEWTEGANVSLSAGLRSAIEMGFGSSPQGEDAFDATIGLFGMINILTGKRTAGEPEDEQLRKIEGWILGQAQTINV